MANAKMMINGEAIFVTDEDIYDLMVGALNFGQFDACGCDGIGQCAVFGKVLYG